MNLEEKKELKKAIIIKHNGLVERARSNANKKALFFSTKPKKEEDKTNDLDYSLQVYDVEKNKIIKTSNNYSGFELMLLRTNRNISQFFAVSKTKEKKSYCSLYDLKQDGKKIFTMETAKQPGEFGFALNGTILFAYINNTFKSYNIKNQKYKEFSIEDTIHYAFPSPDTKHIILYIGRPWNLSHYDIENKTITLLAPHSNNSSLAFNSSSTRIGFFDPRNNTLNLYDTKKHVPIKQLETEKLVTQSAYPNDSIMIFTLDNTTFKIWDIESDKVIDLVTFDSEYQMRGAILSRYNSTHENISDKDCSQSDSSQIIYFYNNKNYEISVYDIARNKIFEVEIPGMSGLLSINNDITYAAYTSHKNKVTFYTTEDTWKTIAKLSFENAKQLYLNFSPCGNYAAIRYLDDNDDDASSEGYVVLYDIKKDQILLKKPYVSILGSYFSFYSDNIISLKSNDTMLILYDYKNNDIAEITTDEEIAHYMINDSFLSISSGDQTELLKFEDIEFKNYKKEEKKEIVGDKSSYCIVA